MSTTKKKSPVDPPALPWHHVAWQGWESPSCSPRCPLLWGSGDPPTSHAKQEVAEE